MPQVPERYLATNPKLRESLYMQIAGYARYMHAQDNLCSVLNEAGIPFVTLKGNAAAIYYRLPSERTMGDIDFQVMQRDFEKARTLLTESGYELTFEREEYIRHIAFKKEDVTFELHRKFSHEDVNLEDYIVPGISAFETKEIDGHTFPMLPKLSNGLFCLTI